MHVCKYAYVNMHSQSYWYLKENTSFKKALTVFINTFLFNF